MSSVNTTSTAGSACTWSATYTWGSIDGYKTWATSSEYAYDTTIGETLTTAEGSSNGVTKAFSQALTIAETNKKTIAKRIAETLATSDSFARVCSFIRSLSETVALTESVAKSSTKLISDSLSISDSIVKNTAKAINESLFIDSSNLVTVATPTSYNNYSSYITIAITTLDETYNGNPIYRCTITPTTSEGVTYLSTITWGHGIMTSKAISFTAGNYYSSSVYWRLVSGCKAVSMIGTASNISGWASDVGIEQDDGWNYLTNILLAGSTRTDHKFYSFKCPTITLNESVSVDFTCMRVDNGKTPRNLEMTFDLVKTISETVALAESLANVVTFIRALAETVAIKEGSKSTIGKNVSETVALTEDFSRVISFVRTLAETIGFTETTSKVADKKLNETLKAEDTIKKTFGKNVSEALATSEALRFDTTKTLYDTLDISDLGQENGNYYADYTPAKVANGGSPTNTDVTTTIIDSPNPNAKTWMLTKDGTASEWNGWEKSIGSFTLSVGDTFTLQFWYRTTATSPTYFGFHVYTSDWSAALSSYKSTTISSDGKWHFVSMTVTVNTAYTGKVIFADGPSFGYSTSAGTMYINDIRWYYNSGTECSVAVEKNLAETLKSTEGIENTIAKILSETLTTSESFARTVAFNKAIEEIITFADSIAKDIGVSVDEVLVVIDEMLRNANAIFSDIAISSGDLTFDSFTALTSPAGYEAFNTFVAGDLTYEKALFKILLETSITTSKPGVSNWELNVDVPDITDKGTATIEAEATTVTFSKTFHAIPEVTVTLKGGEVGTYPMLMTTSKTGFTVKIVDSGGTLVSGSVGWVAYGY